MNRQFAVITLVLFAATLAKASYYEQIDCRGGGKILSLARASRSGSLALKFGPFKDRGSFVIVPVTCDAQMYGLKCESHSFGTSIEQIPSTKDTLSFRVQMDAKNPTPKHKRSEKIFVFNRADCR